MLQIWAVGWSYLIVVEGVNATAGATARLAAFIVNFRATDEMMAPTIAYILRSTQCTQQPRLRTCR